MLHASALLGSQPCREADVAPVSARQIGLHVTHNTASVVLALAGASVLFSLGQVFFC